MLFSLWQSLILYLWLTELFYYLVLKLCVLAFLRGLVCTHQERAAKSEKKRETITITSPALVAKDGVPPDAALKEAPLALTVRSKLALTESLAVIPTAGGISGVVEVVAGGVAKTLEHKL